MNNVIVSTTTFRLEPLPPRDELETLWRRLDATGAHSFFLSWTWIKTLLRTMPEQFVLLKAYRVNELVGVALLAKRLGWLGALPIRQSWFNSTGLRDPDGVMIEHNGFAVAEGDGAELWPAFLRWFASGALRSSELVTPGISGETFIPHGLVCVEQCRRGYRTPLTRLGPDGVVSIVSRNSRQQLRRSLREAGAELRVEVAPDVETAQDYFSDLKRLHIQSWTRRDRHNAFDNPFFEPFHRGLIASGVAEGNVDLMRVISGTRVLGYLYNFRRNGIVSSYQSGLLDEETVLRPGYVCHAMAISHYAAQGERCYDFLAGSNRLKQSFGIETYDLCWRRYRRPTLGVRLEELVRHTVQAARRSGSRTFRQQP